jgi:hypothetical protein
MKPETMSVADQQRRVLAQRKKQLKQAQARHAAAMQRSQQVQARAGAAKRQPRRRRAAAPAGGVLGNLDDARRGIILAEVLGTPKGLRQPGENPVR